MTDDVQQLIYIVIDNMSDVERTYKFDVKMTCGGCSGAVTRVLEKAKTNGEVKEFTVTLDTQEVIVKSTAPYEDILSKIKKTGKEVRSGGEV